jgi:hypothetical protein
LLDGKKMKIYILHKLIAASIGKEGERGLLPLLPGQGRTLFENTIIFLLFRQKVCLWPPLENVCPPLEKILRTLMVVPLMQPCTTYGPRAKCAFFGPQST